MVNTIVTLMIQTKTMNAIFKNLSSFIGNNQTDGRVYYATGIICGALSTYLFVCGARRARGLIKEARSEPIGSDLERAAHDLLLQMQSDETLEEAIIERTFERLGQPLDNPLDDETCSESSAFKTAETKSQCSVSDEEPIKDIIIRAHDHTRFATRLAYSCMMDIIAENYTECNEMTVRKWMQNELRLHKGLRSKHAVEIIDLAIILVFIPRPSQIKARKIMNSNVVNKRFSDYQTRWYGMEGYSWFYEWFGNRTTYRAPERT